MYGAPPAPHAPRASSAAAFRVGVARALPIKFFLVPMARRPERRRSKARRCEILA
jgi:hypothetical protein